MHSSPISQLFHSYSYIIIITAIRNSKLGSIYLAIGLHIYSNVLNSVTSCYGVHDIIVCQLAIYSQLDECKVNSRTKLCWQQLANYNSTPIGYIQQLASIQLQSLLRRNYVAIQLLIYSQRSPIHSYSYMPRHTCRN